MKLSVLNIKYLLSLGTVDACVASKLGDASIDIRKILTDEEIDDLRELCGARLPLVGFENDYSVNSEGRLLEALIDELDLDRVSD